MILEFTKMNGAGNDFVLIDNRPQKIKLSVGQIVQLCHRQRGIGADGLVLWIPCASGKAQWAWDFFNNDGSVAEMCGNASRCFARFVQRLAKTGDSLTFETIAGIITARFVGERVTIDLTQPKDLRLQQSLQLSTGSLTVHSVNTGVPHAVVFVPDVTKVNLAQLGPEIRWHASFGPKGANANFAQVLGPGKIHVRTYERGVEGETLACGTGVTATALVAAKVHQFKSPVQIQVQGGDVLEVAFTEQDGQFSDVQLNGPADFVFEGRVEI